MMKKTVLLLSVFALFLCVSSCEKAEAVDFTDQYLFTPVSIGANSVPGKFNPATGSYTPLCTDPLCRHDESSGCPFGYTKPGWESMEYWNGYIYYTKSGSVTDRILRVNLANNQAEEFYHYNRINNFVPEGKTAKSPYFQILNGYLWGWVRDKETDELLVNLRVSLDTGKEELLPADYERPCFVYEGQYIYELGDPLPDTIAISKTDDVTKARPIVENTLIGIAFEDLLDEDILLYATVTKTEEGYDWEHMTLRAYHLKTGKDTVVLQSMPDVYLAAEGEYIYYVLYDEEPALLGTNKNSGQEVYNKTGGILWRTSYKTLETEKAFELPEYTLRGTEIYGVGQYIVIGYQNTDYENYTMEDTGRGVFYDYPEEKGKIVYDTLTGESKIYAETTTND